MIRSILAVIICSIIALTLWYGDTPWDVVYNDALKRFAGTSTLWNPLLDDRIPRVIVLICSGASFAVAGAVMQALFHNPLASPTILGVAPGSCLLATAAFVLGLHMHPYTIPIASASGALLTLFVVYYLSLYRTTSTKTTLILTGIAISTVITAIQGSVLYALRDRWQLMQTITEWLAGTTTDRGWQHVAMQLPLTIIGLTGCLMYSREISILTLGDDDARNLGVDVETVRWRLFFLVALLTGGAIAAVGNIPFFGLMLPHIMRTLSGPGARKLIPACILGGSAALSGLDISIRMASITSMSIGNISALSGGIFFLIILFRSRTSYGYAKS